MNKAAEIVATEMLGASRGFIQIGSKTQPFYALTLEQMNYAFRQGAMIDLSHLKGDMQDFEAFCRLAPQLKKMRRFVAEAMVRGSWLRPLRVWRAYAKLKECDGAQLLDNYNEVMRMSGAKEVFRCAALMSGAAMIIANTEQVQQ